MICFYPLHLDHGTLDYRYYESLAQRMPGLVENVVVEGLGELQWGLLAEEC